MILVAVLFVVSCGSEESGQQGAGGQRGGRGGRQSAAVPVKVEQVTRGEISKSVLKNTTLEAERWVDVRSRRPGQVVAILREEGDKVREGDVLARLDAEDAELQARQMEVAFVDAQRIHARIQKIFDANLVSEEQFEAAKTQLDRAQAQYEQAKLDFNFTRITSPVEGTVTSRIVEIGNVVSNNQILFSVADFDPLLARILVPEKEIGSIATGQEAVITVESSPGREYQGRVKRISPVVDPQSGTVKVTVEIPASNRTILRPGMFSSVYIITETRQNTLVIPKKALVLEGEGNQVFVYQKTENGGQAERKKITIGFSDNDRLEVVEGLADGDVVITVGQDGLRPGTAVRIVGDVPPLVTAPKKNAGGPVDQLADGGSQGGSGRGRDIKSTQARIFERFPAAKKIFDERVKKDPEVGTDPDKWSAFVRELSEKGIVKMGRRGG
jgi:membrane fusion protein (multidrug efflux system)